MPISRKAAFLLSIYFTCSLLPTDRESSNFDAGGRAAARRLKGPNWQTAILPIWAISVSGPGKWAGNVEAVP